VKPAFAPPPVFTKIVVPVSELTFSDQKTMVIVTGRSWSSRSSILTVPSGVPFGSISMSLEGIESPSSSFAETLLMLSEVQQP
jgi:hypothetical protein